MRRSSLVVLLFVAACKTTPPPPPPPEIDFRQELRPYGQWLVVAPYGKVWAPSPDIVGKNFTPYLSEGQWFYDPKKGWSFDANYKFADLVFHHGRWVHVQSLDWLWVEDKEWGPAWVQWKTGSEYVGWAPLPPKVSGQPDAIPDFVYVKARTFAQPEIEKFRLGGDEVGHATDQTKPLVPAAGAPPGPPIELIVAERGVEKDAKGVYHAAELPPATPPAVEAAPAPEPEPEPAPPPPTKKKKKKKSKTN